MAQTPPESSGDLRRVGTARRGGTRLVAAGPNVATIRTMRTADPPRITVAGREVTNPTARGVVILMSGVVLVFVCGAALVVSALWLALAPVWAVLHIVLRAFGRVGVARHDGDKLVIGVDRGAFRRR